MMSKFQLLRSLESLVLLKRIANSTSLTCNENVEQNLYLYYLTRAVRSLSRRFCLTLLKEPSMCTSIICKPKR